MKQTAQAARASDRAFDREMRPLMVDRPRSWAAWFWGQSRGRSTVISRWGDSGEPIDIAGEIARIMERS